MSCLSSFHLKYLTFFSPVKPTNYISVWAKRVITARQSMLRTSLKSFWMHSELKEVFHLDLMVNETTKCMLISPITHNNNSINQSCYLTETVLGTFFVSNWQCGVSQHFLATVAHDPRRLGDCSVPVWLTGVQVLVATLWECFISWHIYYLFSISSPLTVRLTLIWSPTAIGWL